MLSSTDASLAAREPALPGFGLLFDAARLHDRLDRLLPSAGIQSIAARYVRYKPHTNCLVAYSAVASSGTTAMYAKAHRPEVVEKLTKALKRSSVPGAFGPARLVLEHEHVVVVFLPNDDKIKELWRLLDPEARRDLLRLAVPHHPELWYAALDGLNYKPERRHVGCLVVDGMPAAVTRMRTRAWPNASHRLQSREMLRLPRLLGAHEQIAVVEWIPGEPMNDVVSQSDAERLGARVGGALAHLHAQPADGLPVRNATDVASAAAAAAASASFLCPRLASALDRLTHRLSDALGAQTAQRSVIHGDFGSRQVIVGHERVGIIDLDEVAAGDPACDLGSFLARLERDVQAGRMERGIADRIGDAFLAGYCDAARSRPLNLATYTAAGLLTIAPHPLRDREPDWPVRIEAIVDRALALLAARSRSRRGGSCPVIDPYDVRADLSMPCLARALDPSLVEHRLRQLPALTAGHEDLRVDRIAVARYKPGRRAIIEYDVSVRGGCGTWAGRAIVGKSRARGVDAHTYCVLCDLRRAGFTDAAVDQIFIPEPLGCISDFAMWIQSRVDGIPATELLGADRGPALAARIAEALLKVQRAQVATKRRHRLTDELQILDNALAAVRRTHAHWEERLRRVMERCAGRAAAAAPADDVVVHRDFYADHVLVAGPALYLIDFDLAAFGHPALDAGNFVGHLIEQGVRLSGDPAALEAPIASFTDRFLQLSDVRLDEAIDIFTTLTLARHIYLSTARPGRSHTTEPLIELCEERLGLNTASGRLKPAATYVGDTERTHE